MPKKTLYIRDADVSIWEAAECLSGEKSMSTIVTDALREKLGNPTDGFLNIIRANPGIPLSNSTFAVMFAPINSSGGAMKPRYCASLDGLKALLKQLGIIDRAIVAIIDDLEKEYSANVRVTLTDEKRSLIEQDVYVVRLKNQISKFIVMAPFAGAFGLGPNHSHLTEQEVRQLLGGKYQLSAPEIENLLKLAEENPGVQG